MKKLLKILFILMMAVVMALSIFACRGIEDPKDEPPTTEQGGTEQGGESGGGDNQEGGSGNGGQGLEDLEILKDNDGAKTELERVPA